jgi:hypothetical protein
LAVLYSAEILLPVIPWTGPAKNKIMRSGPIPIRKMHLVIQIRPFTLVVGRILSEYIRDIRKLVKLGLLALSFGKTQVEKMGGLLNIELKAKL